MAALPDTLREPGATRPRLRLPAALHRFRPPTLVLRVLAVAVAVVVPLVTLPSLPRLSWMPVLLGMLPWVVGKYLLCPLRWHALSEAGQSRWWHIRAYAESELLGLLTPGHVGADAWRVRRLNGIGMRPASGLAEVALDRFVGAIGLAAFVAFAGAALPTRMLLVAAGLALAAGVLALVVKRVRPDLVPRRSLPAPHRLAHGVVLSVAYQATICALLLGTVAATGHTLSPLALLGAFGASQLAGAVPGPHGASPRDGALVAALMALGLPWQAALGAVSLKAVLAWLPALLLGGASLLAARHLRRATPATVVAA